MTFFLGADDIAQYHREGYVLKEGLIPPDLLADAQAAITSDHPTAAQYHASPDDFPRYLDSQFSGIRKFPFSHFDLNNLVLCDAMLGSVRQLIEHDDIRFSKGEFWAKYSGVINYEQGFHRDFGNHTLVVPRTDHRYKECTTFIFLSDVEANSGPTALLPRTLTDNISFGINRLPDDLAFDPQQEEILATGPAGTVLFYSYDVFHRGTEIKAPEHARFMVLGDFHHPDAPWIDRQGWPEHGGHPHMHEFITRATPVQRCCFDLPPPGHEYWNEQTLSDMAVRYKGIDLTAYQDALHP
ncbi:MAG: hypothetical protein CNE99_08455 [OM182 bacterium MED-G24]|mgnify:FL=1|uniref:Phytanoyl-CoA dioxygenase n=1 Tax=OM182 bacterium MED-G24 TaxID=1986255 RepID=A0A2A5WL32_9GAMM|nr:MAG: hypothetical protein CNE99_08455 [OM182 bacterium MED-G24]|tara:strand:+ start:10750 stop:11640 length:891 start_codon:yes stop_codon:yes gene_type:complete